MSKQSILSALKNGFKRYSDTTSSIDPQCFIKSSDDDLVAEFIARCQANKSIIIETSEQDLAKNIDEIITKHGVSNLIYPINLNSLANQLSIENKFCFNCKVEEFKERIFEYDVSIIEARGGVSSHGVVCISSKEQPRLLSLTPKVCIAILHKSDILKSLSAQLNKIKEQDGKLPTNVVFISGPSRTSDIELQLVLGVHGSQIFYVILI